MSDTATLPRTSSERVVRLAAATNGSVGETLTEKVYVPISRGLSRRSTYSPFCTSKSVGVDTSVIGPSEGSTVTLHSGAGFPMMVVTDNFNAWLGAEETNLLRAVTARGLVGAGASRACKEVATWKASRASMADERTTNAAKSLTLGAGRRTPSSARASLADPRSTRAVAARLALSPSASSPSNVSASSPSSSASPNRLDIVSWISCAAAWPAALIGPRVFALASISYTIPAAPALEATWSSRNRKLPSSSMSSFTTIRARPITSLLTLSFKSARAPMA
mmetsp:Transcript_34786/g.65501  ORF Transcript_34786/g.65501 Transcript_34786/m.65501 type:complete len:279 (-) Transcript_34786:483-1319(-)